MLTEIGRELITRAYTVGALRFGAFELNSGRISPYYFDGKRLAYGGEGLVWLERLLLRVLEKERLANAHEITFNAVFGPAYGAIPSCILLSRALKAKWEHDTEWMFNRKEKKDHGEGGVYVGANPRRGQKFLLVEDALSSGRTINDRIRDICEQGATVCGVLILLDRGERDVSGNSPSEVLENIFGVRVHSVVTLSDLMEFLNEIGEYEKLKSIQTYRDRYGFPE